MKMYFFYVKFGIFQCHVSSKGFFPTPPKVKGYTTELTRCAGANSIRLDMEDMPQTGNLAVLLRAQGCEGWVPGAVQDERMRIDWPPRNRPVP